MIQVAIRSYQR